jgi:hypothetical protein
MYQAQRAHGQMEGDLEDSRFAQGKNDDPCHNPELQEKRLFPQPVKPAFQLSSTTGLVGLRLRGRTATTGCRCAGRLLAVFGIVVVFHHPLLESGNGFGG